MSVLPQYKTDAIFRVENLDRYDNRDVVITNLLDSYERLMEFGKNILMTYLFWMEFKVLVQEIVF